MDENKHLLITAKIKVVEKQWSGWDPNGAKIPPKENIYEKPSGSRLILSSARKMMGVWGEEDQSIESETKAEYVQKEGFRLFISQKSPDKVSFTPERILEPISGKVFPIRNSLPLKKTELKVGESFVVEPFTMDSGVRFEITLLEIFESRTE